MPDPSLPLDASPVPTETETTALPPKPPRPQSARKSLKVKEAEIVEQVLDWFAADTDARSDWMERRLLRYAKYRGWLEDGAEGATGTYIPLIMWNVLRLQAQLHNAVLSTRPVMTPQAWKATDVPKQDAVEQILDWQVFVEANGSKQFDTYIQGFVEDGPSVMFVPWVKETRTIHDVRTFPPPEEGYAKGARPVPPGLPDEQYYRALIVEALGDPVPTIEPVKGKDAAYTVTYDDPDSGESRTAEASFTYTDLNRLEMALVWTPTVYNGPVLIPEDLENLVVPPRCTNLQPPGPSNPGGAPRVIRVGAPMRLDEIKRRQQDGTYDLLSDKDLATIENGEAREDQSADPALANIEAPKTQKDDIEGITPTGDDEVTVTPLECYCRYDANGDGLEEDVIFWVLREPRKLARARYLTEMYPPAPGYMPRRPFAEAHCIPVKGRWYSMGMIELLESLSDLISGIMSMALEWGEMGNAPFFFYRAASGMKAEVIKLQAGEGYPLDNPQADVLFPTLPSRDQSWALNMVTVLNAMVEKLSMQSALQYGSIPTARSSALRTMGTTVALLQQADIRADQILLRLFDGIAEVYQQIHALNQRYLPAEKEVRIVGLREGRDAYLTVARDQVQGRFDFKWSATLLNADKHYLSNALMEIMSVVFSPMAMQMGLVDPEKVYQALRDYIRAKHQDPEKFLKRPPGVLDVPKVLAEEAIGMILTGEDPQAVPLEDPQEHFAKLIKYQQSPEFAFMQDRLALWRAYVLRVRQFVAQAQAEQQMRAASQQQMMMLQQMMGGGGAQGGLQAGANAPGLQDLPRTNKNEMMDETMMGGGGGGMPAAGGA